MIINPWMIYLIAQADSILFASVLACLVSLLFMIMWGVFGAEKLQKYKKHFADCEERGDDPYYGYFNYEPYEYAFLSHLEKWRVRYKVIMLVAFAMTILLPSSETLLTMFVASYVTTDNLEMVKGNAMELIDYIVKSINESK